MDRPSRTEIKKGTEVQKQRNVDGRTGMEGQEQRDRNRGETGTGREGLTKGQGNIDSGTWTRSGTERQGHDHRD